MIIDADYELAQSFTPAEIEIEETESWFERYKTELLIATGLAAVAGAIVTMKPGYFPLK